MVAAALMEPYLSPKAAWMLAKHEIFQGYYYMHYYDDLNETERSMNICQDPTAERMIGRVDRRKECCGGHEWYDDLVRWCELYDQASFDPGYPPLPLEFFRPMVNEVLLARA